MSSQHDDDPIDDGAASWSSQGSHSGALLQVEDLHTYFKTDSGDVKAVDGVSFDVERGETVAIVGESGSGKTVTSESITRLFRSPPGYIPEGSIRLGGDEVTEMSEKELRQLRGAKVSHIFQNPQGALNPVFSIGWQLREAIKLHQDVSKAEANERAVELLTQVGIPEASSRLDDYPHELSGGMKQRVAIARAIHLGARVLLMDEPFGELDELTREKMGIELRSTWRTRDSETVVFVTHSVPEAVLLGDRCVVMDGLPGRIEAVHDVDLPAVRDRSVLESDAYQDEVARVRRLLYREP
jgi:peptide/nickel transport system ATP-binding protein